jgi:lambda family phage portal protein
MKVTPASKTEAAISSAVETLRPKSAYFSQGQRILFGWNPLANRASDDVRTSGYTATARSLDALHNSGFLSGAVDVLCGLMVGDGLQLAANPDAETLGWDEQTAARISRQIERRWKTWSNNPIECDAAGRQTVGQMNYQQVRTWFGHGEHLATLEAFSREGAQTKTKVNVLDPISLPRETWRVKTDQGILCDSYGFPLEYTFKIKEHAWEIEREKVVPARGKYGRQNVIHVFDGAPGQRRGITPLAPALRRLRQYDQLSEATLMAALIQTIFAATVKSEMPTERIFEALQSINEGEPVKDSQLGQYMNQAQEWYRNSSLDIEEHGKIAHLFPNEELNFHRAETPNATYEPFSKTLLREIARCLPCTFETFSADYTGATYSSVRIGTSEHWPINLYRRKHIAAPFAQAIYTAWLEEEILAERQEWPGGIWAFYENKAASTRASWRGPARPTADDLKSANAAVARLEHGLSTYEAECAENGLDWEEVAIQRGRESAVLSQTQLPQIAPPGAALKLTDQRKMLKDGDD